MSIKGIRVRCAEFIIKLIILKGTTDMNFKKLQKSKMRFLLLDFQFKRRITRNKRQITRVKNPCQYWWGSSPYIFLHLLYKIQKTLPVVVGTATLATYFPNN